MRELTHYRPDYVFVLDDDVENRCRDAHRVVRNAMAIADVVRTLPDAAIGAGFDAIERSEGTSHRMTPSDAGALVAVLDDTRATLSAALDNDWRPRAGNDVAKRMLDEASQPTALADGTIDFDRVFEVGPDGRIGLCYPRMSLPELGEQLPEVVSFLRRASDENRTIVVDED